MDDDHRITRTERHLRRRDGEELELELDVEDVLDFGAGVIKTCRVDNGDLVRSREMTDVERMCELADVGIRNE